MPTEPLPDLARTLEALEEPASVLWLEDAEKAKSAAARLLREMAEDFSFHAGHNPACDSLHWEKRECDCEVAKKLARWRLP